MRQKILFISSWFPNKLEPTNGNFVQRHAEAVALIHDVEILHAIGDPDQKESYLFDEKIINNIRTVVVYYQQTRNSGINFIRRMMAYKKGYSKMKRPDLVHANVLHNNMLFAVYLKKRYKIPFVVTEHWSGFLKINRHKLSKVQLFVAKNIAQKSSYILPVSRYLLNDLNETGFKNKMEVIGNVVDTNLFHLKKSKNIKFTFLHISNLIKLKNPYKIITVACRLHKEFPDFELHIGGDGDVEALNRQIKENNAEDFIKTFPMISSREVSEKMRASHCFVLFSDNETQGCVLLESLSTGTPAIATNVGGIPEIINDKNGILISNSEDELFEAMKKVLTNKTNFDTPEKLHDYIDSRFSMRKVAEKFDEIYQEILN